VRPTIVNSSPAANTTYPVSAKPTTANYPYQQVYPIASPVATAPIYPQYENNEQVPSQTNYMRQENNVEMRNFPRQLTESQFVVQSTEPQNRWGQGV
jgi:hypothetical protein